MLRKNQPVKGKRLNAENSTWVRFLEMKKAAKLRSASKQEIKTPESEKPAVVNVITPAASLTPEQIAAAAASLTPAQIAAIAHLNYVTNKEIRDEFGTEARYVAFVEAKKAGRIRLHGPQHRAKNGK